MRGAEAAPEINGLDDICSVSTTTRLKKMQRLMALLHIVLTIKLTGSYMAILTSFLQNDYLWTRFNTSGAQTFMSDAYNSQLWNTTDRVMPLFSPHLASEKDYSIQSTEISIVPTDTRRIIMEHFQNIAHAIHGLRSQTTSQTTRAMRCYCWLDFNRHWEVAHTFGRQQRCHKKYLNDGTAYMETMLRNTDWTTWNQMYGPLFDIAYGMVLKEITLGVTWLDQTTKAMSLNSVEAEVKHWLDHNVTQYTLPWHNRHIAGFDNYIVVQNSLQRFSMVLDHIGYQRRIGSWTSVLASYGVYNDLYYAADTNSSLIRNASNSFMLLDYSMSPEMWTGGYPDTPWSILLHDTIGPLSSIDLQFVLPPPSVISFITDSRYMFIQALLSDSMLLLMNKAIPSMTFRMIPPSWQNSSAMFYGGNPFCYNGKPWSYAHQSFGYDDACSESHPRLTVESSSSDMAIAMWIQFLPNNANVSTTTISNICAVNLDAAESCNQRLKSILSLYLRWSSTSNLSTQYSSWTTATSDIVRLQVEIMQYAMSNNTPTILRQPLVDMADSNWSFFGWLHILDWVSGLREVVAFEGDVSTFVLMSKQYPLRSFSVSGLETPTRFSFCIRILMWYMCVVTGGVTMVALVYGILHRGHFNGRNLSWFNCVLGIVWLGRPLLVVRGITAITLLSSANIKLVKTLGMTYFSVAPRSLWDAFVISGETVWLTYAAIDILTLLTRKHTAKCAILSASLVWVSSFAVDVAHPFLPSAKLSRTCESSNMDAQVSCVSGIVQIGSDQRFILLCSLQVLCIVISYGVARCLFTHLEPKCVPVIVPAIASYLLDSDGELSHYYDSMSSVFSGLLPWKLKKEEYVFSIGLWICFAVGGVNDSTSIFRKPTMRLQSDANSNPLPRQNSLISRTGKKLRAVLAFGFLIISAFSSALFFYVSQVKLSNDFLWEGFNTTGMQTFLVDWYNSELKYLSSEVRDLDPLNYNPSQS